MGMRVLSLFDGMSCGQIALKELGIIPDVYYASEIDKHAIATTMHNFPNTVQLGSVTDVDARRLGHIDLLIGGSPCFAAGTKILTKDGYKNIEDVRVGDEVLTHMNRYRKVVDWGVKIAETFELKSQCATAIVCTKDHKFFAKRKAFVWQNDTRTRRLELGDAEWVEAEKLCNNYYVSINEPKPFGDGIDVTEEEAFVLGRYLADGHTRKDFRHDARHKGTRAWKLILSIGSNKVAAFRDRVRNIKFSDYPHSKNVRRFVFSSKRLVELAEKNCGCGASDKFISNEIMNSSACVKSAFLAGYLSGDGSVCKNRVQISTVSGKLALSLQRIILDVEGVHANIAYYDRGNDCVIEGRSVKQKPQYVIHYTRGVSGKVLRQDGKIWFGVKSFKEVGVQPVYNITVDEDHSYTANNVVVKNCTNFSFAGRRNGMNTTTNEEIYTLERYLELKAQGFAFDGESFLFWEYMRILGELRETNPNVLFFLENVEMGEKWESVLTKAIGIEGVHVNSALVSAQTRKRIYWTNISTVIMGLFGKPRCDIPKPKDRGIFIHHVINMHADEKYYLSQKRVDELMQDIRD